VPIVISFRGKEMHRVDQSVIARAICVEYFVFMFTVRAAAAAALAIAGGVVVRVN
jgi:hypothetical protein